MPYYTLYGWGREQPRVGRKTIVKAPPKTMADAQVHELAAEVVKLTLEKNILKKRRATSRGSGREVHLHSWAAEMACIACLITHRPIFSSVTSPQTEHVEYAACDDCNRCAHDGCNPHEPCQQRLRQRHDGSLWATLKKELVHDKRFRTHDEVRAAIFV